MDQLVGPAEKKKYPGGYKGLVAGKHHTVRTRLTGLET